MEIVEKMRSATYERRPRARARALQVLQVLQKTKRCYYSMGYRCNTDATAATVGVAALGSRRADRLKTQGNSADGR
jgi:hypothetical protein